MTAVALSLSLAGGWDDLTAGEVPLSSSSPKLEALDVGVATSAESDRVRVPVRLSRGGDANFAQIAVMYDPGVLAYRGFRLSPEAREAGWRLSRDAGFREVQEGHLSGQLVRESSDDDPPPGDEDDDSTALRLFDIEFAVSRSVLRTPPDDDALWYRAAIRLAPNGQGPGGSDVSSVGRVEGELDFAEPKLVPTRLENGSVTIYYGNFVEVSSGAMTRRAQSFALPLHVTLIDDLDIVWVGVDYDELILRDLRRGIGPSRIRDVRRLEEHEAHGHSVFELVLSPGASPMYREPVGDLEFEFDGELGDDLGALRVVPSLLDVGENADGGGASSSAVAGVITFLEPHFVRGNVDSSDGTPFGASPDDRAYAPDMIDALAVLRVLFLEGEHTVPCREAADTNDDAVIDVTDAVMLLSHLFRSGEPPAAPFPRIGIDPRGSPDHLGCSVPVPYFELHESF